MIVLRTSRAGEETLLGQTAHAAFKTPDPDSFVRYFHEHSARSPADTIVAEMDGRLAGHLTALRLEMRFHGVNLPFRGVAAVAVVPERRQFGIAERLLDEHVRRMRARREPLSLLYPFSVGFYQKHGWGIVEWVDSVRVAPRALPASPLRRHVRRLDVANDVPAVRAVYDVVRDRSCGFLRRDDYWWDKRVFARVPEKMVYADPERGIQGYLLYEVPNEPAFPVQHILVRELVAATLEAQAGLVGFLAALGNQYAMVELLVPRGTGATLPRIAGNETTDDHALFKPAAATLSGAMARLIDVPNAFAVHPGVRRARGQLGIDVTNGERTLRYDLGFGVRGVQVRLGRRARYRLALSIDRLSQVYFGGASATLLIEQGHASGAFEAAALLDEACAGPPLHLLRMNLF
jgi:predicted acetyltransferase